MVFVQKIMCVILFLMICCSSISEGLRDFKLFNLNKYGAREGGKKDNKQALLKAWDDACKWKGPAQLLIPKGTYLVTPTVFEGPCNNSIWFRNRGVLRAPGGRTNIDKWISFQYVDFLTIDGGGTFDGQGRTAWSDDKGPDPCILMRLDFVRDSRVRNVRFIDSKNVHLMIFGSNQINIDGINIRAPEDSPNTDGIKIGESHDIKISNTRIGTGDDCIAILHGSRKIDANGVYCGPGHGISIGSMGGSPDEDPITNVLVRNSSIFNATNGLRIKTWAKENPTSVSHIMYKNIVIKNTYNPIIIDQNYCSTGDCPLGDSYVQISDVKFHNVMGTSLSEVIVDLQCSRARPCRGIEVKNINIKYKGDEGTGVSSCSNVRGSAYGIQRPRACVGAANSE